MADTLGSGGPATSNGNGVSTSRPTAPPAQTGSPRQGIKAPTVIWRERQERLARQQEEIERNRAEQEAKLQEETQRRVTERQRATAGAASGHGGEVPSRSAETSTQRRHHHQQQSSEAQGRGGGGVSREQPAAQPHQRQTRQTTQVPQYPTIPQPGGVPAGTQAGETSAAAVTGSRTRSSFPHAFERWETLSAHWEGLTSFWIHKLQERTEELDRDPLSRQLNQHVQDLSAAGANLFHAVVELQRLRASSERKFQRWFFETRSEQEREREVNAMLESTLEEERRGRADAIRDAVEHERANSRIQKQMTEMRKELIISKEEARRAWEELGRREQEERERTISLQQGRPTIVGGVQVVPMSQGVPSRRESTRDTREERGDPDYDAGYQAGYSQALGAQPTSSAAAGPSSTGGFYQQPAPAAHEVASYGAGSEGGYSEGEYAIAADGSFIRDSRGNRIPFGSPASHERQGGSDPGAEEYETPASAQGLPASVEMATPSYPPASSQWTADYGYPTSGAAQDFPGDPADYSGQGYGSSAWEPRHHHPTRLSDVIEEDDERSRTSGPSQVSRA